MPERVTLETNPKEEAIVSGNKGGYYKNRFKKLRLQNQQNGGRWNDKRDDYVKVDGKWYIKRRRTTFMISDKHVLNG